MIPAAAAALAAALVAFFHLRSTLRRRGVPFPSLELLSGVSVPRRPALPVEEPLRLAARLAVILLLAAALLCSRCERRLGPEVDLFDGPAAGSPGAVTLRFDGEKARAEAPARFAAAREIALRSLGSCSGTRADCLLRAGRRLNARPVIVSDFSDGAFREALRRLPGPFDFVRLPPRSGAPSAPAPASKPDVGLEVIADSTDAARLWGAALGSVKLTGTQRIRLRVTESEPAALEAARNGQAVFLPVGSPAGATEAHPPLVAAPLPGTRPSLDEELVSDVAGIAGPFSMRFESDPRFEGIAGGVLARRRFGSGVILSAAASPEDLGSLAHAADLDRLARVAIAALLERPALLPLAPAGGNRDWVRESDGSRVPVGLIDTGPGTFRRSDGAVLLELRRRSAVDRLPVSDRELLALGGRPHARTRAPNREILVISLLVLSIVIRLADAPRETGRRVSIILLFAGGLVLLTAFLFDARLPATKDVRPILRFEPPGSLAPGNAPAALGRLLRNSPLRVDAGQGSANRCDSPESASACEIVGTVGAAKSRLSSADSLYFPADVARVDLLFVEVPEETAPGERGQCRATVRVRRARGRRLRLEVRATDGPAGISESAVGLDDQIMAISAPLSSIGEGVRFASVAVSLADAPGVGDARAVAWIVRARSERALLASGAPGWDSRFLGETIESTRRRVESITRLGKTALLARSTKPENPLSLLSRRGSLDEFSLVVLTGFEKNDLPAAAARNLESFVAAGGGLLLAQPDLLPSLSPASPEGWVEPAGTRPLRAGAFGREWTFEGYPPAHSDLAAGSTVLARLGEPGRPSNPWIVGRGLGKGRVAVVLAPDLWRVAAPGSETAARGSDLLAALAAWLTAARPASERASLSADLVTLRLERPGTEPETATLPATGSIGDQPVDPSDPLTLLPEGRARLRVEALRHGRRMIEADSLEDLAASWRRFPPFRPLAIPVPVREDDRIVTAAFLLLTAETFLRRRRRPAAPDSPPAP